jgi:RecA-family ATPase
MLLDIAARVSRDGIMPDGEATEVGDVLILSAEDDPEDTIKPRLQQAGAVLSRFHNLEGVTVRDGTDAIEIPRDLDALGQTIEKYGAKLVIIDPLMAFLNGVDSNNDQSVRQALKKLRGVARKHGCAIVCIRHLNKSGSPKAMYRGGGSIGIIGHARSALLVAEHPDDQGLRLLASIKCNLGAKPKTLAYVLKPHDIEIAGEKDTICSIEWKGECDCQADHLVAAKTPEQKEADQEKKSAIDQAADFLNHFLKDGPKAVQACYAEAAKLHIAERTLRRASEQKVKVVLTYNDPDCDKENSWQLPPSNPPADADPDPTTIPFGHLATST